MNSVLKSLPKVELHRHLVGSIRLQTILDLAQEYKFPLPVSTLGELKPLVTISPNSGKNLGFILREMAKFTQLCFPSRAAISRIAFEMIEDAFLDGLIYLEVRFSPVYMTAQGNLSQVDVIEAVLEGLNQANRYFPVQCGVIVGINREMGKKVAKESADLALAYAGKGGVVGFDLAGDEAAAPPREFENIFIPLRADGRLGITIHAGEGAGARSVADAINYLGAQRIGHGVRAVEDPDVLDLIQHQNITLETCPTSNVITGAVQSFATHPLRFFLEKGISATINSDDPTWFNTTLTDEYSNAIEKMNLSLQDLAKVAQNAALGSFLPLEERLALADKIAPMYTTA